MIIRAIAAQYGPHWTAFTIGRSIYGDLFVQTTSCRSEQEAKADFGVKLAQLLADRFIPTDRLKVVWFSRQTDFQMGDQIVLPIAKHNVFLTGSFLGYSSDNKFAVVLLTELNGETRLQEVLIDILQPAGRLAREGVS